MANQIKKDPGISAVLSFLFTGAGQIYNGEIGKGVLFMIVQCVNYALMFIVIGFITYPITWILCIMDAHNVAKRINEEN